MQRKASKRKKLTSQKNSRKQYDSDIPLLDLSIFVDPSKSNNDSTYQKKQRNQTEINQQQLIRAQITQHQQQQLIQVPINQHQQFNQAPINQLQFNQVWINWQQPNVAQIIMQNQLIQQPQFFLPQSFQYKESQNFTRLATKLSRYIAD